MPAPRVLISDALSPAAVQIFKDRGIEVDFQPDLGKDKDKLAVVIGDYDGLAIRSATKVTAKLLERANGLKVIGRAGIGVDNVDIPAATARGVIVMNTPFGNSITTAEHAIAMMFALPRKIPQADASTQAARGEETLHGRRLTGKTLGSSAAANRLDRAERAIGFRMHVSPTIRSCRRRRGRAWRREGRTRRAPAPGRRHHLAHAADRENRNILSADNIADAEGRAHRQLRRGGLVDEVALRAALDSGQVREPPSTSSSRSGDRETAIGHPHVV